MNTRKIFVASLSAALLSLGSCTAKYQDMIRDRDETIRDLESKLSATRGQNARLKSELDSNRNDLAAARNQANAAPAAMTSNNASLESMKRALRDSGLRDEEVQARYRGGRLSLGIANQVTFSPGSTILSKTGQSVLRRLASVLRERYASKSIWVEGHTDSDPIKKSKFRSNRHLSAERADAVAAYLVKRGIPGKSVIIVGHGPNDPINGRRKDVNRRVEIVVTD